MIQPRSSGLQTGAPNEPAFGSLGGETRTASFAAESLP